MPPSNDIANGGTESAYTPIQLFAGESQIVTGAGTFASGFNVAQYTVLGRNAAGKLVPHAPNTGDPTGDTFASGTITLSGQPSAADTVTVAGTAITFVASGATGNQVNIAASATLTAQALKAFINANHATFPTVNASGDALVITITAETAGSAGNAITLAKSGTNLAVSAATLAGGSDNAQQGAPEAKAIGIAAYAVDASGGDVAGPYYEGGYFNHEALVWPAALSTLDQRRAAFDGTPIHIRALYGAG